MSTKRCNNNEQTASKRSKTKPQSDSESDSESNSKVESPRGPPHMVEVRMLPIRPISISPKRDSVYMSNWLNQHFAPIHGTRAARFSSVTKALKHNFHSYAMRVQNNDEPDRWVVRSGYSDFKCAALIEINENAKKHTRYEVYVSPCEPITVTSFSGSVMSVLVNGIDSSSVRYIEALYKSECDDYNAGVHAAFALYVYYGTSPEVYIENDPNDLCDLYESLNSGAQSDSDNDSDTSLEDETND